MMRRARAILAVATVLFAPMPVVAHIGDQFNSIHFNSGSPDFGELPRRAVLPDEIEVRSTYGGWGQDDDREDQRKQALGEEVERNRDRAHEARDKSVRLCAAAALAPGQWATARKLYASLGQKNGWTGDLRDRVAVLGEAASIHRRLRSHLLRAYFHALDSLQDSTGAQWAAALPVFRSISGDPDARFLAPFARYQMASIFSAWYDYPEAIREYRRLIRDFPKAAKREDALIMLARAAILPATPQGRDLAAGSDALSTLLSDYHETRFRRAAIGLRARVEFLDGRYASATEAYFALDDLDSVEAVLQREPDVHREPVYPRLLCSYLRRLNRAENYDRYVTAVHNIRRTITDMTPAGAGVFVARLRREPGLSAPYFYYRLYHCDNDPVDIRGLARLARCIAGNAPSRTLSPQVEVRFAEVYYKNREYSEALRWANRAGADSSGRVFDRAEYVLGAASHKLRHFADAKSHFIRLLTKCPDSELRLAAREALALSCEALGDLSGALDEYFRLDYRPDIAFLVDARMSARQLETYIASCPDRSRRDFLTYSLGMRYLRSENWSAARHEFELMPSKRFRRQWDPSDGDKDGGWSTSFDDEQQDPRKTLRDLSRLQEAAARPNMSTNARASALYRYATYYYKHGTLLLYNNAAWEGDRAACFDFWWNNSVASPADITSARSHMYRHEVYARTEAICRRIARDYPDSPTAPYALYRGACAASKLANFNGWWRGDLRHHDHFQEAANMMSRLAHRYPRHPLAAEARKFAGVFGEDSLAMADERRSIAKDEAGAERDNKSGYRHPGPGWFP